jgi:threonine/homoserine/homoserine lactone efflux protein
VLLLADFLKGVFVGLIIAVPVGPVGILCVRRTLIEGEKFGLISGLGAASADAFFGIVAGFGLTYVQDWLLARRDWLGLGAGIFLLAVGLKGLLAPREFNPGPIGGERLAAAFLSTFAIALTNPLTILVFAAIFTQLGFDPTTGAISIAALVAGVFSGSLAWWFSLCFGAPLLRGIGIAWLPRLAGAILAVSGAGLLGVAFVRMAGLAG